MNLWNLLPQERVKADSMAGSKRDATYSQKKFHKFKGTKKGAFNSPNMSVGNAGVIP